MIRLYVLIVLFISILHSEDIPKAKSEDYRVRFILYACNGRSRQAFLKRIGELKEHSTLSMKSIEDARLRFINTGYYAEVSYYLKPIDADKKAAHPIQTGYDLVFVLKERITRYPFPLPIASYYPERSKLPFKDRVEVGLLYTDHHFLGRGERLAFTVTALGLYRAEAEWVSPWLYKDILGYDVTTKYSFSKDPFPKDSLDITKDKSLSVETGLRLFPLKSSNVRLSLGYQYFRRDPSYEMFRENGDACLTPKLEICLDERDIQVNPLKGYRLTTTSTLYEGLYKEIPFINQHDVTVLSILPIYRGLRLASGGAASIVIGRDIPPYRQGHWGGASSIRGYDEGDFEYRRAVRSSLDLRFPIIPKTIWDIPYTGHWGKNFDFAFDGGVFVDAGYLYCGTQEEGTHYYHDYKWISAGGIGLGIRCFLPFVGVCRLDYGVGYHRHIKNGVIHLAFDLIP